MVKWVRVCEALKTTLCIFYKRYNVDRMFEPILLLLAVSLPSISVAKHPALPGLSCPTYQILFAKLSAAFASFAPVYLQLIRDWRACVCLADHVGYRASLTIALAQRLVPRQAQASITYSPEHFQPALAAPQSSFSALPQQSLRSAQPFPQQIVQCFYDKGAITLQKLSAAPTAYL